MRFIIFEDKFEIHFKETDQSIMYFLLEFCEQLVPKESILFTPEQFELPTPIATIFHSEPEKMIHSLFKKIDSKISTDITNL